MDDGRTCDLKIRHEEGGDPTGFGRVPADFRNAHVWLEPSEEQLQLITVLYDGGLRYCFGEVRSASRSSGGSTGRT